MKESAAADLNQRIAERVRDLRAARGLSLDALATKSGVSRSMISLIERGESSPTAVVLEQLATGLGVTLASLFDAPRAASPTPAGARQGPAAVARSAVGLCAAQRLAARRGLSRSRSSRCSFPAGRARGLRDRRRASRACTSRCGCWKARSTSRVGDERHRLRAGDCLALHARPPDDVPQPDAKARALRRGDRVSEPLSSDDDTHLVRRRLHDGRATRRSRSSPTC